MSLPWKECRRVYNNGEVVSEGDKTEGQAKAWLEWHKTHRFGCAAFIGHECVYSGYLDAERCQQLSERFKEAEKFPV